MRKEKISVVLPIYNVERYLERCLQSVTEQTYMNLEIILVDDGSKDSCPQICDNWAKKDNRIKVIHKSNAGLGMARNTGIENATGKYICFIDSDDYIDRELVEKSYNCAIITGAELVIYGFNRIDSTGKEIKRTVPNPDKKLYTRNEIEERILPELLAPDRKKGNGLNLWMSAWNCLYSMDLVKQANWRFVSERQYISEDLYSLLHLYAWVNRVAVLPEALYNYCENHTSLTQTYRTDRFDRIRDCICACQRVCDEQGYSQEVKRRLLHQYLSYVIGGMKLIIKSSGTKKEKTDHIRAILLDPHFQDAVRKMDISHENLARRILIEAIKYKNSEVIYWLVKVKT